MSFNLFSKFFESFHHELDAVVREVRILGGFDLRVVEDENGSD